MVDAFIKAAGGLWCHASNSGCQSLASASGRCSAAPAPIKNSRKGSQESTFQRRPGRWPLTQFSARGDDEDLDVLNIVIDDRLLAELETLVDGISPSAVWIIERLYRGRGLEAGPMSGRADIEAVRSAEV